MPAIEHLLDLADRYIAATCVEDKTLSWRVFADSKKLGGLRTGNDIQLRRYEAAVLWFAENWPAGAEWPSAISRPVKTSEPLRAAGSMPGTMPVTGDPVMRKPQENIR